jgi:hypothetical protein
MDTNTAKIAVERLVEFVYASVRLCGLRGATDEEILAATRVFPLNPTMGDINTCLEALEKSNKIYLVGDTCDYWVSK